MKKLILLIAVAIASESCTGKVVEYIEVPPAGDPHLTDPVTIPGNGGILSEEYFQGEYTGKDHDGNDSFLVKLPVNFPEFTPDPNQRQKIHVDIPYKVVVSTRTWEYNLLHPAFAPSTWIEAMIVVNGKGRARLWDKDAYDREDKNYYRNLLGRDACNALNVGVAPKMYLERSGENTNRRGSVYHFVFDLDDLYMENSWGDTGEIIFYLRGGSETKSQVSKDGLVTKDITDYAGVMIEFQMNDVEILFENTHML